MGHKISVLGDLHSSAIAFEECSSLGDRGKSVALYSRFTLGAQMPSWRLTFDSSTTETGVCLSLQVAVVALGKAYEVEHAKELAEKVGGRGSQF